MKTGKSQMFTNYKNPFFILTKLHTSWDFQFLCRRKHADRRR